MKRDNVTNYQIALIVCALREKPSARDADGMVILQEYQSVLATLLEWLAGWKLTGGRLDTLPSLLRNLATDIEDAYLRSGDLERLQEIRQAWGLAPLVVKTVVMRDDGEGEGDGDP